MNDDYLWDKSGTPDPEIEQLEQLLGDLRYRRPGGKLPLPQRAPVSSRQAFRPAFAIAAAVLFLMVAAGAWFALGLRSQEGAAPGVAVVSAQPGTSRDWLNPDSVSAMTPQAMTTVAYQPGHGLPAVNASPDRRQRRSPEFKRGAQPGAQLARSSSPKHRERISEDEGVAAREQLIKALHLASSKLNQVQKKMQDNKTLGPVS